MSTLRVALAQILSGADPEENLELVATRTAEAARQDAQLVVFPEATMRRFGLPLAEIAEPVDGPWAQRLRKIADTISSWSSPGCSLPAEMAGSRTRCVPSGRC